MTTTNTSPKIAKGYYTQNTTIRYKNTHKEYLISLLGEIDNAIFIYDNKNIQMSDEEYFGILDKIREIIYNMSHN